MEMDLTRWGGLRPLLGHTQGIHGHREEDVEVNKKQVCKDANLSAETVGEDIGRVGTRCCEIGATHTRTQSI